MNEMATVIGIIFVAGLYFAAWRLSRGRADPVIWRIPIYAGWVLVLIGSGLVVKDWWDLHTLYQGLAESVGSTGARDFMAQYHIAFPRTNGVGTIGIYLLLVSAVLAVVAFVRAIRICGPKRAMEAAQRAFHSPITRRLGWLGYGLSYVLFAAIGLFAMLLRKPPNMDIEKEQSVFGVYNYRKGKLDDGLDPFGWYED
jgi:protein-S-isoprenylcysteine O-methyltransferase Ste14